MDEHRRPGRFVVLGSASPDLTGLGAETLAGRVSLVELAGFRLGDLGSDRLDDLWLRGGLPPSCLAADLATSNRWRDDCIATFLERDLANLGVRIPATAMRRFWTMVAHHHGQTWNGTAVARSVDVSASTVRRYLDALTDALVVRQLPPWVANDGMKLDTRPTARRVDLLLGIAATAASRWPPPATRTGSSSWWWVTADLDCTGGWWSRQSWDAVPLAELMQSTDAPTLEVTSLTGYSRLFPARDAANLYLAVGYGGEPLRRGHGAPVRLVALGRRGFWWVKWVSRVDAVGRPWWLQLPFPLE